MERIGPPREVLRKYLLYADDVICLLALVHKPTLQLAAWENAADSEGGLAEGSSSSARGKSLEQWRNLDEICAYTTKPRSHCALIVLRFLFTSPLQVTERVSMIMMVLCGRRNCTKRSGSTVLFGTSPMLLLILRLSTSLTCKGHAKDERTVKGFFTVRSMVRL